MRRTAREGGSELYCVPHDKHPGPICLKSTFLADFQFLELPRILTQADHYNGYRQMWKGKDTAFS